MFLPQRGVLAPARSLAGQLLYPAGAGAGSLSQAASLAVSPDHLRWLLQAVGLGELWERAAGDWQGELGWLQVRGHITPPTHPAAQPRHPRRGSHP